MTSFLRDLKLLHPTLRLRQSSGFNWKAKLIDPAVPLAEWSDNALDLLEDVGGIYVPGLPDDSDSELPAVDFFPEIVEDTLSLVLADIFNDRSSVTFRHELDSQFPWWRESNLWRKANRYPHYDQFLNFVAFASSESIPEHAKSKWTALACAALIEVHYFICFLKSMSKPLNEEFKDYYKHMLDNAFEIYRHCDLALRTRDADSDAHTESPESADWKLYRSLSNRLSSAICTAARRMTLIPRQLYLKGVSKIGQFPAGGGGFADVWMGKHNGDTVALKVPRSFGSDSIKALMYKEVFVWHRLHHRNILPLLGITKDSELGGIPECILVSPWMANGNLSSYLKNNCIGAKQQILFGIKAGLMYLHGQHPPVIHGDLRCHNILVDDTGTPLLADFGLSKAQDQLALVTSGSSTSSTYCGSLRWQAPEVVCPGTLNSAESGSPRKIRRTIMSDVYLFAMTCLEVNSEKMPFDGCIDSQITLKLQKGHMPDIPKHLKTSDKIMASIREEWWTELQKCWKKNAAERPNIEDTIVKGYNPCMWQVHSEENESGNLYYWYSKRADVTAICKDLVVACPNKKSPKFTVNLRSCIACSNLHRFE